MISSPFAVEPSAAIEPAFGPARRPIRSLGVFHRSRRPISSDVLLQARTRALAACRLVDSERVTRYSDTGDRKPAQVRLRQITRVKRPSHPSGVTRNPSGMDGDFPLLISLELLDHRIRPMYNSCGARHRSASPTTSRARSVCGKQRRLPLARPAPRWRGSNPRPPTRITSCRHWPGLPGLIRSNGHRRRAPPLAPASPLLV